MIFTGDSLFLSNWEDEKCRSKTLLRQRGLVRNVDKVGWSWTYHVRSRSQWLSQVPLLSQINWGKDQVSPCKQLSALFSFSSFSEMQEGKSVDRSKVRVTIVT